MNKPKKTKDCRDIDTEYSCVMQKPTRKTRLRSIKPTYSEGANDERDATLAYVRRQKANLTDRGYLGIADELAKIEQWLLGRAKRYNKAKGGLGKKG